MKNYLLNALGILGVALLAPFAVVGPATAQQNESQPAGASGGFSLTVHSHSEGDLLFGTDPLPFPIPHGSTSFTYSSRACNQSAPFNDVALDFSPDYPGLDDPAPVRHKVEGSAQDGKRGTVTGTITTILCESGAETKNTITTSFTGKLRQASDDQVPVTGTYQITGGTGMFQDITGHGSITGQFECLGPETCVETGELTDAVFRLKGSYADPTV